MKTSFDFSFDLNEPFKQHGYTLKESREDDNKKSFYLFTCKHLIQNLDNNQNLNKKVVFAVLL